MTSAEGGGGKDDDHDLAAQALGATGGSGRQTLGVAGQCRLLMALVKK